VNDQPTPQSIRDLVCAILLIPQATDPTINALIVQAKAERADGKPRAFKAEPQWSLGAVAVLNCLNEETGKAYQKTAANLVPIQRRLDECKDIQGMKDMVKRQAKLWMNTEMQKYLRPETLFRASKFDAYYQQRADAVLASVEDTEAIRKQVFNLRAQLPYVVGEARQELVGRIKALEGKL
jgi:uncharacterized phage protein (TIGR02220 family)